MPRSLLRHAPRRLFLLLMIPHASLAFLTPTPTSFKLSRRLHSSIVAPISMTAPFPTPDALHPYRPPRWADGKLRNIPKHGRLRLANLPTPVHSVGSERASTHRTKLRILSRLDDLNIRLYFKRDDATGGSELGGNKVRKLEFLLAEAVAEGCDAVVTVGGEQSNHCRATAAASRMVGLSPHIILRTARADAIHNQTDNMGWTGNVLFDRLVGSTIYTCTAGEYGRLGSNRLVQGVCDHLQFKSKTFNKPYPIPVGGSNGIGSWGYINGVDELMNQLQAARESSPSFAWDHIVFATGSGGTAAGIALGLSLAYGQLGEGHPASMGHSRPSVHAVGVCDSPNYFYDTIAAMANDMGLAIDSDKETIEEFVRNSIIVHQGKGRGYAVSSDEELDFIVQFSLETGIALDPVYSGKALFHFLTKVVEEDPESYRDSNILFWHTGGALGIYEKGIGWRQSRRSKGSISIKPKRAEQTML
ncbi:hypothetical protein ACHAW6_012652 [Cyclotella cf. meneghiniana]